MPEHRLLLIRHAEAAPGSVDVDRPLTASGGSRATTIGSWLADARLVPDRVLVSPARRARETWAGAAAALAEAPPADVDRRIHENTVDALLAVIGETAEDVRVLAVVGHNPSIGALAHALDDGEGDAAARTALERGFPAGGVAVFSLDLPFARLAPGTATLLDVTTPGA